MSAELTITWSPFLPWPALAVLAGLAALLLALSLWRRADGVWWRAAAAVLLLMILANPSLVEEQREALSDIVLVVVDDSPSQGIETRQDESEAALNHVLERLGKLEDVEVRVVRGEPASFGAEDRGTRLFAALSRTLSKVPRQRVGAIVMISDGMIHDVPEDLDALALDAPLHLLLSGRKDERDRRLTVVQAPSFGIVGRRLSLNLRVDDLPESAAPGLAKVTLSQDGREARTVMLPIGRDEKVEFELDHRGPSVLEIAVEAGPDELTLINNHAAVVVNGVRERLRVLLVSGEPHAGERAWRNILKSDPSVDLVHFTILRPPEKQDGTPIRELSLIAFPTRELFEVKLDEFDLIIFDRYRRRGVLPSIYLDNIARYVEAGGALLEAVGPTFSTALSLYRTPLGRVLPGEPTGNIFEEGYQPRLTPIGLRHPVTAGLTGEARDPDVAPSWGRWFRQIGAEATAGVVVMKGVEDRPLLILDRVGEGRVAQLMSDHMWLWSRGFEGGGPQAELLRRMAHWLMKEPDLEEEDLRATVNAGRLEVVRRSLSVEVPEIQVTTPSGALLSLTLEPDQGGQTSGSLAVSESGLYRVSDGLRTALAGSGPLNPLEFADVRSTAEPLEPLIEASDGAVMRLANQSLPGLRKVKPGRDRHGRDWIGVQANGGYLVTGVDQVPLLPAVIFLLLTLGTAVFAWYREGR
jgi:hypothetical protein